MRLDILLPWVAPTRATPREQRARLPTATTSAPLLRPNSVRMIQALAFPQRKRSAELQVED